MRTADDGWNTVTQTLTEARSVAAALASDYTTSSATDVSTGFKTVAISPARTGEVLVSFSGLIYHSAATDTVTVTVYRAAANTAAPAAGAAPGGSDVAVWTSGAITEATASSPIPVAVMHLDTGLTKGDTYVYYIALAASAASGGLSKSSILMVKESW